MERGRTGNGVVRLVMVDEQDGLMLLDAIVLSSDAGGAFPAPGQPTTLPLVMPEPGWVADALRELLREWAATDALVKVDVTRSRRRLVARLRRDEAVMSLAVAGG